MKKTRKLLVTVFMGAMMLLTASCSKDEVSGQVLATSGDSSVMASDYIYFFNMNVNQMAQLYSSFGMEIDMKDVLDEDMGGYTMREMIEEQSLYTAQSFAQYVSLAQAEGIEIDNIDKANIDEDIKEIKQMFPNKKDLEEAYGMNEAELRDFFERLAVAEKYMEHVENQVSVSVEEIRAFYDENISSYENQVTVKHILISSNEEMSEEEQAEAKELAEELLERVNKGEDIGTLATEYSEDGGSAQNGGEYTFGRGRMVPEFEEWAYSAKEGDTGIVKTDYGYHVMQMIKTPFTVAFEDVMNELESTVHESKVSETFTLLLDNAQWAIDENLLESIR